MNDVNKNGKINRQMMLTLESLDNRKRTTLQTRPLKKKRGNHRKTGTKKYGTEPEEETNNLTRANK